MRLAFAFCADAAQMTPDGKVFVLGGDFDAIHAREFPARHPMMSLVVKLAVQPTECQREHELRVDLIDSDGQAIHKPIKLRFRPEPNPQLPDKAVGVGLVINFQNLEFPKPGDYAFHILVDHLELGTVALALVPAVGTDLERKQGGE